MRIGILTGGGDCPGLNAALRAAVEVAVNAGDQVIGFHHGWRGVVEGDGRTLDLEATRGILQRGGTILHTARYHPNDHPGGTQAVMQTLERDDIDALIVIGGDGTLGCAIELAAAGVPIVGIPKTIDNDVPGTERCIGYDTAVATAADAIDRVHTTGESHDRLMVVEVMGRTTGWLAVAAGIAAGADAICVPERALAVDELARAIERRHDAGATSTVVVVAEGAQLARQGAPAQGSVGAALASELEALTAFETRLTVLGHVQRGGPPVPSDRILATRFGVAAVEAVHAAAFNAFTAWADDAVTLVSLKAVLEGPRPVSQELLSVAEQLTIYF